MGFPTCLDTHDKIFVIPVVSISIKDLTIFLLPYQTETSALAGESIVGVVNFIVFK